MVNASYIFLESASVLSLLNSPSTSHLLMRNVSIFKVNLLKQAIQHIEEILGDMTEII